MNAQLWKSISSIYDADLKQRLQYCWDDLDLLDQSLKEIQERIDEGFERALDAEQAARILNLIYCISLKVDHLLLTRAMNAKLDSQPTL